MFYTRKPDTRSRQQRREIRFETVHASSWLRTPNLQTWPELAATTDSAGTHVLGSKQFLTCRFLASESDSFAHVLKLANQVQDLVTSAKKFDSELSTLLDGYVS